MPTGADHLPSDTTALIRRLAALERDVRELRAARRLEAASVGAGGLRIVSGGRLSMTTTDGVRMVDVGEITDDNFDHLDGTPQQAVFFRREDGTRALSIYGYPAGGNEAQAWTWYDRDGTIVLAEDAGSGTGLARPWIPMTAPTPSDPALWGKTTAGAFTTVATSYNVKWQPRLRVFANTTLVGTATGEVQFAVNGVAWGPVVTAGTSLDYTGVLDNVEIGEMFTLDVQGRRLTGTGSVAAQVRMIYGRQT
ncbi:hypothetical protein ACFYY2_17340 [Streptomyces sp. NPDC001822]|uniref:hypothetical protein n=1 Tax=Streptomyces sp. NPDC001822 TaxID=3364614 RepID=UPI003696D1A5